MVSFLDPDPLEQHLEQSVSMMTDSGLYKYCELYFLMSFNHSLKDNYGMAMSRLKWLRSMYDRQTGDILKWVWYRHNGLRNGQKFTFSWFTQKQLFYVKEIQGEMAGHRVELLKRITSPAFTVSGFMTSTTLSLPTTAQIIAGGGVSTAQEQISH